MSPRDGLRPPTLTVHRQRRLREVILTAVHRACDDGRLDLAAALLRLAEVATAAETDPRRRRQDLWSLVAAHERLWHLRHSDPGRDCG